MGLRKPPRSLSLSASCWGTAPDRAAVYIPTSLPAVRISHIFYSSLVYLLLLDGETSPDLAIEPGRGYYPQTNELGGGRRLHTLTRAVLGILG